MATSEPKQRQVEPLTSISFFSLINHAWKVSGIREKLAEYCYAHALAKAGIYSVPPVNLDAYSDVLDVLVRNILKLDCLPHALKIKLGNCMLDFDGKASMFLITLASALSNVTKENVDACVDSLVMSPSGHIDKQKTLFKLIFDKGIDGNIDVNFTGYHCVSFGEALDELRRRYLAGEWALGSLNLNKTFSQPLRFWEEKQHCEGMGGQFFQCVAVHGTRESMEYYLSKIDHSGKAKELCKAACHVITNGCDPEKILFFYEHLDPDHWQELLRRHFYTIFAEMIKNKRYRHMCVVFYSQAVHTMEFLLIKRILAYLCELCSVFVTCETCLLPSATTCESVDITLFVDDLVPMFLSIWRITPLHYREMMVLHEVLHNILNTFLYHNKFHLVAAIINDPALSTQRNTLTSCVVMKLIISMKKDKVSSFLRILEDEKPSTNELLLTLEHLKVFIPISDKCSNIRNYNELIQLKFPMVGGVKAVKELLIEDETFIIRMIDGIKEGYLLVGDVEKILKWIFSDNSLRMYTFIQQIMLPRHFMEAMYKNYIISSKRSIYTIDCFNLTDFQIQTIRRGIASDVTTLHQYCYDLLISKDFGALPKLLTSVFSHDLEREHFLRLFFRSEQGVKGIYSMLVDDCFDHKFFCRYLFRKKLRQFLDFKKYWIITEVIASDLDSILVQYGHPNQTAMSLDKSINFLPHESVGAIKLVCNANYTIFKCLLTDNLLVGELITFILGKW